MKALLSVGEGSFCHLLTLVGRSGYYCTHYIKTVWVCPSG
jgi:hypothetical protein